MNTGGTIILILLNWFVEKSSLIPLAMSFINPQLKMSFINPQLKNKEQICSSLRKSSCILKFQSSLDIGVRNMQLTRNKQYQDWAHMHGPTDPRKCAISFHLPGKKLQGAFNLILSGYILDAWSKTWVLKPRTFALSTLLYEHTKSAFHHTGFHTGLENHHTGFYTGLGMKSLKSHFAPTLGSETRVISP